MVLLNLMLYISLLLGTLYIQSTWALPQLNASDLSQMAGTCAACTTKSLDCQIKCMILQSIPPSALDQATTCIKACPDSNGTDQGGCSQACLQKAILNVTITPNMTLPLGTNTTADEGTASPSSASTVMGGDGTMWLIVMISVIEILFV